MKLSYTLYTVLKTEFQIETDDEEQGIEDSHDVIGALITELDSVIPFDDEDIKMSIDVEFTTVSSVIAGSLCEGPGLRLPRDASLETLQYVPLQ